MPEPPERISDSISDVLRHLGAPAISTTTQIPQLWERIVDPVLAQNARPGRLTDGVLTVIVTDPAVESELKFRAGAIAEALTDELGDGVVTALRIRREWGGGQGAE